MEKKDCLWIEENGVNIFMGARWIFWRGSHFEWSEKTGDEDLKLLKSKDERNDNIKQILKDRIGILSKVAWLRGAQRITVIFWKLHNKELGKVKKFETSRPIFSGRISNLKKVQAQWLSPPPIVRVNLHVTSDHITHAFLFHIFLLSFNHPEN